MKLHIIIIIIYNQIILTVLIPVGGARLTDIFVKIVLPGAFFINSGDNSLSLMESNVYI